MVSAISKGNTKQNRGSRGLRNLLWYWSRSVWVLNHYLHTTSNLILSFTGTRYLKKVNEWPLSAYSLTNQWINQTLSTNGRSIHSTPMYPRNSCLNFLKLFLESELCLPCNFFIEVLFILWSQMQISMNPWRLLIQNTSDFFLKIQ